MRASTKLNKLNKIYKDLHDDGSNITTINNRVDRVIEEFNEIIYCSCNYQVESRLQDYKERYQDSDYDIVYASNRVQAEYNAVQREEQ